jgi:hypothetical protein
MSELHVKYKLTINYGWKVDDGEWNHNDGDDVGNLNCIVVLVKVKCVGLQKRNP